MSKNNRLEKYLSKMNKHLNKNSLSKNLPVRNLKLMLIFLIILTNNGLKILI